MRARVPVYCFVVDGATQSRTVLDALTSFSSTKVRLRVIGPFSLTDPSSIDDFIGMLRDQMIAALAHLRNPSNEPSEAPVPPVADR
jgi:hypothetical protein